MRGDLAAKLYDGDAGIAFDGPSPGASAQSRYAAQEGNATEMNKLRDLFIQIDKNHTYEPCVDTSEIDIIESSHAFRFPEDLKAFYREFKSVKLFDSPYGAMYRFVQASEIHPTRIDIYGIDADEYGPSTWLTICDVLDGNYIAFDIASGKGGQFNYIDCFHETFAVPGDSRIIARTFTELLHSALDGDSERQFYGQEGFVAHGDAMPLTAKNASHRIENPEAPEKGWLVKFFHQGKGYHKFFGDREYGSKDKSFEAVKRYIEEAT